MIAFRWFSFLVVTLSLHASVATAAAEFNTTLGGGDDGIAAIGKVDSSTANFFTWVRRRRKGEFLNFYRSINVGGDYDTIFKPGNGIGGLIQDEEFLKGLVDLQNIVAQAETDGKRVRAYGSKYTMNNMLYTSQYLVQSWGLNYHKIGIEEETHVTEAYNETRDCLVFVQSGVRIKVLNQKLFDAGFALKTSPTTDAARIVGAVSTASHGSNLDIGPLHATVKAIHIVHVGEHTILQRASDPVVTNDWAAMMGGATLLTDDDKFDAALVSFGSFGLIHGMLIEVEPLYELAMQTKKFDYDDVKSVLETPLDVRKLGFEGIEDGELPYHFEMTINPYHRKLKGVYARVFRKLPITAQSKQESAALRASREAFSTDSFAIFERLCKIVKLPSRIVVGLGLRIVLDRFFSARKAKKPIVNYPQQFFFSDTGDQEFSRSPVSGLGWEVSVPLEKAAEVVEIIVDIVERDPIAAPIGIRFNRPVGGGTMSFIRYGDITATIELPGPGGRLFFRYVILAPEQK